MTTTTQATWAQRYPSALMNTFGPPRLVLARGRGSRVWDVDGREYLDLFAGIAVNALGHAHPALIEAVTRQLSELGHVSNFFASRPQIELAERLIGLLGRPGRVFFTNSGTEANETAFKLTRRTGRAHLVATEGAFHGRTMGALALTGKDAYRAPFEPLPGQVTFVPYGDQAALAAAVNDQTAAIVLEPIQGEAGVIVPPRDYLAAARRIADAHGSLVWLDEVQTGVGRTGAWFAHQNPRVTDGVVPDIVTMAKGLGGGIPIGACVALGAAGELLEPGNHGSTFGGNPVACAAGLAVLSVIEAEGLMGAAIERGAQLTRALLAEPEVSDVQGAGLLLGAQLSKDVAATVVSTAQDAGFLLNNTGPSRLRFAPALVISEAEISRFGDVWGDVLANAHAQAQESAT
jgi:acetylornithine aminotransferase